MLPPVWANLDQQKITYLRKTIQVHSQHPALPTSHSH